jgi:hypothetical protein
VSVENVRSAHSDLIKLAAAILRAPNMPLSIEDRKWYRTTPIAERREIIREADAAHEQCRLWAIQIKEIADKLVKP